MGLVFKLLVFFLISHGINRLFNNSMDDFKRESIVLFTPGKESIAFQIRMAKGKKKRGKLFSLIYETEEVLNLVGRASEFPIVCFSSVILTAATVGLCIMANNYLLIFPLSLITVSAPFVYIRQRALRLRRMINEELETALSIITNSYIRNQSILIAVEENIGYIHPPIRNLFAEFLFHCDYVSSDLKQNIRRLRSSIDNKVFQEWCTTLISCQNDSNLRFSLLSIVKKLSYIRIVSVRLDASLYEPVREFIFMVLILIFNVPVFYVLNRQWFHILTGTVYGHITIALITGIVAFCFGNVIRLTKPIEYQR